MSSPLFRVLAFRAYAAASTILLVPLTLYLLWVAPLFGFGLIIAALVIQRIYGRYRLPEETFSEVKPEYLKAGKALAKAELAYANVHKRSEASSDEHATKIKFKRSTRGIRAKKPFLYVKCDSSRFIATNKTYWLKCGDNTLSGNTADITMVEFKYDAIVEDDRPDDEVVGSVWQYATKNGERDWRFKDNQEMYRVRRKGLTLQIGKFDLDFYLFSVGAQEEFEDAFQAVLNGPVALESPSVEVENEDEIDQAGDFDEQAYYDDAWPAVLNVEPAATIDDITASYLALMEQYNPDHVAHLGEKIRSTANEECEAIKAAYRAALRSRGVFVNH
ncbi:MAG: hypothetical protein J0I16_26665 [Rhizobiales bacterium]|nr:hypothetical protein [Hyphomicrobiales bacterium]